MIQCMNVESTGLCSSRHRVLTSTHPQPQSYQDIEDYGLEEEQPEAQYGHRNEVHFRTC